MARTGVPFLLLNARYLFLQKKKIENYRNIIFFINLKLLAIIENDDRDNAFIKFKWPEPENDFSISEDIYKREKK